MKRYKWSKGLKKALMTACAVAAGLVGGMEVLGGLDGLDRVTAVTGAAAIVAGLRIAMNYGKQKRKNRRIRLPR